ncbi:MAG: hypothetical protein AAGF24_16055 [Cyanobacteria bacterium P01_H01_bin.121]
MRFSYTAVVCCQPATAVEFPPTGCRGWTQPLGNGQVAFRPLDPDRMPSEPDFAFFILPSDAVCVIGRSSFNVPRP